MIEWRFKKNHLNEEIVPISSDTPPIETINKNLDGELNFLPPTYYVMGRGGDHIIWNGKHISPPISSVTFVKLGLKV